MTFSEFGLASPWKGHGISKWKFEEGRAGTYHQVSNCLPHPGPTYAHAVLHLPHGMAHWHIQCPTWSLSLLSKRTTKKENARNAKKTKQKKTHTAACLSLRPYMRRLGFPIPNEQTRQLRPSSKICIHRCVSVWQLIDARLFLVCHAMLSNVIRLLRITDTNSSLAKAKKVNLRGTTRRNRWTIHRPRCRYDLSPRCPFCYSK